MRQINAQTMEYTKNGKTWIAKFDLQFRDGTVINNAVPLAGTTHWRYGNATGNGGFPFGGASIGTIETDFYDDGVLSAKDWTDAKATVRLELQGVGWAVDSLPMGTWYIGDHQANATNMHLILYDMMSWLDLQSISIDDFPGMSVVQYSEALNKIIENTPITLSEEASLSGVIRKAYFDKMTKRECLSYMCQCNGKFAFIENDKLIIRPITTYDVTQEKTRSIDLAQYSKFSEQYNPVMITGFRFVNSKDSAIELTEGDSTGYIIEISNPFLTSIQHIEWCADFVGGYIHGGEIALLATPLVQPGDLLYYESWKDNNSYWNAFYANEIEWSDSNMITTLTCDAEPAAMMDLRQNPSMDDTSETDPVIFATGSITLDSTLPKSLSIDGIVPAKYRTTYVVDTIVTSGTVTLILKNRREVRWRGTAGSAFDYVIRREVIQ